MSASKKRVSPNTKKARKSPAHKGPKPLTAKQEAFAHHYAVNGSATAAYRHAYGAKSDWTEEGVRSAASKVAGNDSVVTRVAELRAIHVTKLNKKFEITSERVAQELAGIAFLDAGDYFEWGYYEKPLFHKKTGEPILDPATGKQLTETIPFNRIKSSADLTEVQRRAVVGVVESVSKTGDRMLEVKLGDKKGSLVELARQLGMYEKDNKREVDIRVTSRERVEKLRSKLGVLKGSPPKPAPKR
jgi:hypothetical protein